MQLDAREERLMTVYLTKIRYPVDVKCWELAELFLSDVKGHVTEMDKQEFAELIQRCCEDFVSAWDDDDA
jgi:hypothetical protein